MKRKKVLFSAIVSLFSSLLILANSFENVNASTNTFDFSYSNSQHFNKHSAEELIENITNKAISPAESAYLKQFDSVLKYDDKIPSSNVFTTLDNDVLTIKGSVYKYTDVNNNTISWVPYKVNFNNESKLFDSNYSCKFENVPTDLEEFEIIYKTSFALDNTIVNDWLNKAYNIADYYVSNNIIENGTNKYENEYKEYQDNLKLYNQYVSDLSQYEKDIIKYDNYLVEKEKFDDKKEDYDKYLLDLEGCEIIGYDPYCYTNQTITIKYKGQETSFELCTGQAYESAWEYEIISEDEKTIRLTNCKLAIYGNGNSVIMRKLRDNQYADFHCESHRGQWLRAVFVRRRHLFHPAQYTYHIYPENC